MANNTLVIDKKACPSDCQVCIGACAARENGHGMAVIEKIDLPEKNYHTVSTCNQCSVCECIDVCPTGAMTREKDGFVALDPDKCIGCGLCNMMCPYGGIFSSPSAHQSMKCDGCGGNPVCVPDCPEDILSYKKANEIFRSFEVKDRLSLGLQFCAGCTMELVNRTVMKVLGNDVVLFGAPSCNVMSSRGEFAYYGTLMTNVASSASGVSRYFKKIGRDTICLAIIGDGATADIGFGALSAAAERNERILYICYDNEAYMNTGIQRSGTTPFGSWTNTTQISDLDRGKSVTAKDVPILMAEHGIPYAATATLGYMEDFVEKLKKAKEAVKTGMAYIHVLAPCPTGWKSDTSIAVDVTRDAVQTNYFPLWECENGNYHFTHVEKHAKPIEAFTKNMKRFSHMSEEEVELLQKFVDKGYKKVKRLVDCQDI
ncbi:4Fe-4S binding protein [Fusibacter paucivorans]|uniref:4Fe-4S binding protein n=1 Tax=Fusibacter paucivorans TaxID=76009 RepID=A0ABS5PM12_9FIRM|nr:thiamine pyrophosphate-dependent enzyme [Fusibacter paucivorans]MBS7526183.1 4Fe-4S binding protein [Fusibacter paucivorans]